MTRVGLILEQCLAPVPGGVGRYSRELAVALRDTAPAGSSVEGVTAFHRKQLDIPGVPVWRLPLPRRPLIAAWERGRWPVVPGDVVHAPSPLHPRRGTAPLVVTIQDAVPWTFPRMLTPRGVAWHRAMIARAVAEADLVVVTTQATADELAKHVPIKAPLVVGLGRSSDLDLPADADERAARMDLPERFVLTISTLEPRKGLRELAAAMRSILDVPLLCVGQAGWGEGVPEGGDVRLLGRVPDPDLAVLLDRASALAVPSYDEGFGLPLLEGMAAGTPVLISQAPALVEVAGGAALSVPLTDLVDGLRQVLDDEPLRARLRAAGPRRAADFSWHRSAEILWRAYSQLRETGRGQA
ncbi:MAG: glycosyl transferase group 1 [Frankiales bacterium]|nr:glycosyl transferase group 1 [Frankiales bacterium]